jgi:parvulin-like peptidyl-prolyl isomerase
MKVKKISENPGDKDVLRFFYGVPNPKIHPLLPQPPVFPRALPKALLWVVMFFLGLALASCTNGETMPSEEPTQVTITGTSEVELEEPTVTLTPTTFLPSDTPSPLALQINGEGILLEDYEAELARYRAAVGTGLATFDEDAVLDDLIDQVLLAQAAHESGFVVDDILLQEHIQELGLSEGALTTWITENGYSEDSFQRFLTRAIAAAWMRDQLIAAVPDTAEQVHARQILLYNLTEAEVVYAQLEAGTEFGDLTAEYEPVTKGELGWFPRGYLTVPELDDVLFSLEPGAYSPIIQTTLGYHIVQVLEREPDHILTADARRVVQLQTLMQWLETRRNQSEIISFLP